MVVRYTLAQVAEAWGKRYTAVRLLRKALEEGGKHRIPRGRNRIPEWDYPSGRLIPI